MIWSQGHVDPWWHDDHRNINYEYLPLTNTDDEQRWQQQGYSGFRLNGGTWSDQHQQPPWAEQFRGMWPHWHDVGLCVFVQNTMDALPLHADSYNSYRKRLNIASIEQINRCIVFLEDWQSGHYMEIDGRPIMPWIKGDWVSWQGRVPHFAANIGTQPRYTMQITGWCDA